MMFNLDVAYNGGTVQLGAWDINVVCALLSQDHNQQHTSVAFIGSWDRWRNKQRRGGRKGLMVGGLNNKRAGSLPQIAEQPNGQRKAGCLEGGKAPIHQYCEQ